MKYLEEKNRYITKENSWKCFTAYGFVVNDDEETERYGLEHKCGEAVVAFGLDDGEQKKWSQFIFLDYDEEEKIRGITMTDGEHYRFGDTFESWEEMNEALEDMEESRQEPEE